MGLLNVKAATTVEGQVITIDLGVKCREVLVKNFGEDAAIYVGVDEGSTKTDGMVRIPSESAQVITVNMLAVWPGMTFDRIFVYADASVDVEVQAVSW